MKSRSKYSKILQLEEKKRKEKKAQKCRTAIKILEQYERLAQRRKTRLSSNRLARLKALRDAGTITIKDLPASLHKKVSYRVQSDDLSRNTRTFKKFVNMIRVAIHGRRNVS